MPARLVQRIVADGYAPEHVNVAQQRRDPGSQWSFMRTLISTYRLCPELGWGVFSVIDQPLTQVLAHRCDLEDVSTIAVHNLSADPVTVELNIDGLREGRELVDLFSHEEVSTTEAAVQVALEGYGFRWLRLRPEGGLRLP
jgi:hypothetical protein